MDIACLVFDHITALDLVGPCEVLAQLPGVKLRFVAKERGVVRADGGMGITADHALDELTACDLLLVPGGFGARKLQSDERVLAWLRAIDATTRTTVTICTGSILLAAAGLLRGRRATTHWAFFEDLAKYGAEPVSERIVRDGKYACSAGVSAGIDLALSLAIELSGRPMAEAIQLAIEYDPQPPLQAGNAAKVDPALRARVYERSHARDAEIMRGAHG